MPSILLLGFGNVLRGDDGVGARVAERLAGEAWPEGVRVAVAHQLLPEHAEWLSKVDRAVFVDAAVDVPAGEVAVSELAAAGGDSSRLEARGSGPLSSHHVTPQGLLAACATLDGRLPRATLVRIGVASTDTSMALSADLEARFEEYCERVRALVSP